MNSYKFKYYSAMSDKWLTYIIPARSLQAAIARLKGTRTIVRNQYRIAGCIAWVI